MFDLGRSSRALLLALLLAPAPEAAAQSPTWAKTTTGCQIWDPWGASETLSWSGPCTAGKATGKGTLQRGRGAAALAYDGTLRDGRAHAPAASPGPMARSTTATGRTASAPAVAPKSSPAATATKAIGASTSRTAAAP